MSSYSILLLVLFGIVIFLAIFVNRYLLKMIRPRESFVRFLLYFVVVLAFGFGLTILFSHIILHVLIPLKN